MLFREMSMLFDYNRDKYTVYGQAEGKKGKVHPYAGTGDSYRPYGP
jgi:hypothetical protein